MPKVDIDYSNTIFYKIYCKNPSVDDIYIGHTTNFVQRKHTHKQSCLNNKSKNHNCKLYKVIRENDGWKNWNMEIIAFHACEDHYSARKLEQNYFEEYKATLNSIQPLPKPKPKPQPITIPKEEKIIRTCESCNVSFSTITQQEIHNKTNKHIKKLKMIYDNMGNTNRIHNKPSKKLPNFSCEKCKYNTSNKKDYNKHILTTKHKILTSTIEKIPKTYICDCGKEYKHASSLSYHKKKCNLKKEIQEIDDGPTNEKNEQHIDDLSYKNMFIELMKQNRELQNYLLLNK
jgi:hypothetical protein